MTNRLRTVILKRFWWKNCFWKQNLSFALIFILWQSRKRNVWMSVTSVCLLLIWLCVTCLKSFVDCSFSICSICYLVIKNRCRIVRHTICPLISTFISKTVLSHIRKSVALWLIGLVIKILTMLLKKNCFWKTKFHFCLDIFSNRWPRLYLPGIAQF